jgi:hypothetical protein
MALSFPLNRAAFFDLMPRRSASMHLGEALIVNQTGGGEVIESAYGSRLWQGSITTQGRVSGDLDEVTARIELLLMGGGSFLMPHPVRIGPAADPAGTILGAATPSITAVNANNRDITISGLPAGYVLRRGDLISWTYLSGPTRYALHRVVTQATANGSGVLTTEIMPPVRPGHATPQAVTLVNAVCKAKIVHGSYQAPEAEPGAVATLGFSWVQTLR